VVTINFGSLLFTAPTSSFSFFNFEEESCILSFDSANVHSTANAGMDISVSLPQTWALLDGSQSNDDNKITAWKWEQLR
jgi:hypothetical protein